MIYSTLEIIVGFPRYIKRLIVFAVDVLLCILSLCLAYYLRYENWGIPLDGYPILIASMLISIPIFYFSGLYLEIFRYSGFEVYIRISKAVALYAVFFFGISNIYWFDNVPIAIPLIQPILLFIFVAVTRFFARMLFDSIYGGYLNADKYEKIFIYGVGPLARDLINLLKSRKDLKIIGLISSDNAIVGSLMNGVMIYSEDELLQKIETFRISEVLLADPLLEGKRRSILLSKLLSAHVRVRTISNYSSTGYGLVDESDIQELDFDDLLGREPVEPHKNLMYGQIYKKTVLVTGAGGSIGGEICRQAIYYGPNRILLVEQSEFNLYKIHQELTLILSKIKKSNIEIIPLLGSIQDGVRIQEILSTWMPDIIFHSAAYKHVPLVEHNPVEGLLNNVYGTRILAELAVKNRIKNFVLISTDKAVRPTNIMGASKRLSEMILQAFSEKYSGNGCLFSMVRFGNVLGSSGSVVPKFRDQIRAREPVTLTHEDVTRYFMSISEAAQLVIQASALSRGGDIFLLDMGRPVKILELAHRIIRLSGLRVYDASTNSGDIAIKITGLRPGEKLHEELLISGSLECTVHPKIMFTNEKYLSYDQLEIALKFLEDLIKSRNLIEIESFLIKYVSGYVPNAECVDWVFMKKNSMKHNCQTS